MGGEGWYGCVYRFHVEPALGLAIGDAHIIRNAGKAFTFPYRQDCASRRMQAYFAISLLIKYENSKLNY